MTSCESAREPWTGVNAYRCNPTKFRKLSDSPTGWFRSGDQQEIVMRGYVGLG